MNGGWPARAAAVAAAAEPAFWGDDEDVQEIIPILLIYVHEHMKK
jgi:hypothetical protein